MNSGSNTSNISLRSKLNSYTSPFDEAMSKPLISSSHTNDSDSDVTQPSRNTTTTTLDLPTGESTYSSTHHIHSVHSSKLNLSPTALQSIKARATQAISNISHFTLVDGITHKTDGGEYKPPQKSDTHSHNNNNFGNEYNDNSSLSTSTTTSHHRRPLTTLELNEMDINTALLRERHEESEKVAQSMRQIHEINQDLATLVQSQQETIDQVESDAYGIHDNAERGVSNLQKAKNMMKVGMKQEGFQRIFFAVMAIGGLMIAVVLFLEAFL